MPDDISASGSASASANPESVRQPNAIVAITVTVTQEATGRWSISTEDADGTKSWCNTGDWTSVCDAGIKAVARLLFAHAPNPTPGQVVRGGITKPKPVNVARRKRISTRNRGKAKP